MRSGPALAAALGALLLLTGCTGTADHAEQDVAAPVEPVTAVPTAPRTLVVDSDPVAAAVSTSRALFTSSPVVVLADSADQAAELLGASAAVGLGVPLLLGAPDGGQAAGGLDAELDRLGVTSVLAIGDGAAGLVPGRGTDGASAAASPAVVAVPAALDAVEEATGLTLVPAPPVPADGAAAAVAALDPGKPAALAPAPAADTSGSSSADTSTGSSAGASAGSSTAAPPSSATSRPSRTRAAVSGSVDAELPEVHRAAPLSDVLVLASGRPGSLAGLATARAAGTKVLLTHGSTDPRASAEVVQALAAHPASVLVLGADFGAEPGLDWKLDTAATGQQLPGGGQLLFSKRMLVALYGIPGSGALGVLGEQDLPASIARAQDMAAQYRPLVDVTVVPTFEIIATVASASPGPDGNYSTEGDLATLRPWVEAAGQAGLYVVLDLQPGRTDFLTQAKEYQSLLELPYVGLALDPEWRLEPGQVHLQQIGQVGVDEVNRVVGWLADLTREHALPQKLLVLHQFQVRMIIDRERLDTSRDELALMVHADGQGGQAAKQSTWQVLHHDAPSPLYWGWKNFVDEDLPMLTPQQTIEQVHPTPQLVTYQ